MGVGLPTGHQTAPTGRQAPAHPLLTLPAPPPPPPQARQPLLASHARPCGFWLPCCVMFEDSAGWRSDGSQAGLHQSGTLSRYLKGQRPPGGRHDLLPSSPASRAAVTGTSSMRARCLSPESPFSPGCERVGVVNWLGSSALGAAMVVVGLVAGSDTGAQPPETPYQAVGDGRCQAGERCGIDPEPPCRGRLTGASDPTAPIPAVLNGRHHGLGYNAQTLFVQLSPTAAVSPRTHSLRSQQQLAPRTDFTC